MTAQLRIGAAPRRSEASIAWMLDQVIAIAGLLVVMGVFQSVLSGNGVDRTQGSTAFQVVSGSIYLSAIASLFIGRIPYSTVVLLGRSWPLVLLTALTLVSTLWSQAPDATFRRSIALILTSLFALFLVVRFNRRSILNLFAISFAIFCIGSVLAAAIPGVGISQGGNYSGAWQGLSGQKNVFGRTIAVGLTTLCAAVLSNSVGRRKEVVALAMLALMLLALSRSATSLVATIGSFALGTLFYLALGGKVRGMKLRLELGLPFLLIALFAGFVLVTQSWDIILAALGRSPTLTGRVKLWEWAIHLNASRWLLGSGYKAFWIDANTLYFSDFFWWDADADGNKTGLMTGPDHSHSGYVDILLELGYVGILSLSALILSSFVKIRQVLARGGYETGYFLAVILSFILVYAITEKSFLQQSEDLWLVFMVFYLLTAKEISAASTLPAASVSERRLPYDSPAGAADLPTQVGRTLSYDIRHWDSNMPVGATKILGQRRAP